MEAGKMEAGKMEAGKTASPTLLQFTAILSPFIPNPQKRTHWGGGGHKPL